MLLFVGAVFLLEESELLKMRKLVLGYLGVYFQCEVGKLLGLDRV